MLGPLLFLICINDLVDNISSEAKLFADDTSLFTVVYDVDIAADQLNRDLKIISNWVHQWKMQFNPDKTNRPFKLSFLRKKKQLLGIRTKSPWTKSPRTKSPLDKILPVYFIFIDSIILLITVVSE